TAYNINRNTLDLKLSEFGKIYNKTTEGHQETYRLAILMSGNKSHENWARPEEKTNFFTLKGKIFEILKRLGINQGEENPYSNPIYSDALSLEIDGKTLGNLGKIHKNVLKKADISQEIFYAELNWELMLEI